jgi:hypothetical protein
MEELYEQFNIGKKTKVIFERSVKNGGLTPEQSSFILYFLDNLEKDNQLVIGDLPKNKITFSIHVNWEPHSPEEMYHHLKMTMIEEYKSKNNPPIHSICDMTTVGRVIKTTIFVSDHGSV